MECYLFGRQERFLYGGGSGNAPSSIGAYVAKIDPERTSNRSGTPSVDTTPTGEWNYPGTMAILNDGYLYAIYSYRLSKLDPSTGQVITTLRLPTGAGAPQDTAFNGFSATHDGTIVAKSFYRQAGCTEQGPQALTACPTPRTCPTRSW